MLERVRFYSVTDNVLESSFQATELLDYDVATEDIRCCKIPIWIFVKITDTDELHVNIFVLKEVCTGGFPEIEVCKTKRNSQRFASSGILNVCF